MATDRRPDPCLMSHGDFRKTDAYRMLCADYDIDPAADWDRETVASLDAAREFFCEYEALRRAGSAWTAQRAAAALEGLLLSGEGNASGLVWTERFGPVLVTEDPLGQCWMFTAQRYDPIRGGLAMTLDQADRASQQ